MDYAEGNEDVMDCDEVEEDNDDDLPKPFFDELEGVFRCVECHWEVIDGQCQFSNCGEEHANVEVNKDLLVPQINIPSDVCHVG